ncbi:MAG: iron-containing alcohol dehydrogenase [Rhodobacterales bacterium]|nr:iron-containing alcohol dehydrogenase [Rhodobacterales bacterium]
MPASVYEIARLPRLLVGPGTFARTATEVAALGRHALVVTGARSFTGTPAWGRLRTDLEAEGLTWTHLAVAGEPSPEWVDEAVLRSRGEGINVVLAVGGGSALDAGKALAGLLLHGNSVMDHLEGVGPELPYGGPALPFVAVPTTAGTGSEATKNAVLSRHGPGGFKKSFRDPQLVARVAIVDPDLLATCPPAVVAANGMDAFTQLLESLCSLKANRFTDALAWDGLAAFRDGFWPAWRHAGDPDHAEARAGRGALAHAALMSGICLAQTGLGAVHGLAQPLGSLFPIPHGVVCGTTVGAATRMNMAALTARAPDSPALAVLAKAGRLLGKRKDLPDEDARALLADTLDAWTDDLALPRLSAFGVGQGDIPAIVANSRGSSMKTNPVVLTDDEVAAIVQARL